MRVLVTGLVSVLVGVAFAQNTDTSECRNPKSIGINFDMQELKGKWYMVSQLAEGNAFTTVAFHDYMGPVRDTLCRSIEYQTQINSRVKIIFRAYDEDTLEEQTIEGAKYTDTDITFNFEAYGRIHFQRQLVVDMEPDKWVIMDACIPGVCTNDIWFFKRNNSVPLTEEEERRITMKYFNIDQLRTKRSYINCANP